MEVLSGQKSVAGNRGSLMKNIRVGSICARGQVIAILCLSYT